MASTTPSTTRSSAVVLDNALLHGAANFAIRSRREEKIRNVALLGLSALADALVMHERITVDRRGWQFFTEAVPQAWLPSIEPMLDVIDVDLPPDEVVVAAVAGSESCVLLGYALTVADQILATAGGRNLNTTYFTYTGSQLGEERDEQHLISLLEDRVDVGIPGMHLHLRSADHVAVLQCLVRALQYQHFANELGQAYVPHDFRGRVLNVIFRERVQPSYRAAWEKFMTVMSDGVRREYEAKLQWITPLDDGSFAAWERLEMPLFLSMALERTRHVEELFHRVREIRDKARPLRELIEGMAEADGSRPLTELAIEARRIALEIASPAPSRPTSVFSAAIGLPPSVSLRMNLPTWGAKRSVAFVRDVYDNHAVPMTLASDVSRVFGCAIQPLTIDPLADVPPAVNALEQVVTRIADATDRDAGLG